MIVLSSERRGEAVYLMIEEDNGEIQGHVIIDGSLESRAALYGLADEAEALEALLVEWHILPADQFLPEGDPAAARDLVRKHKAKVKFHKDVDKQNVVDNMKLPKVKADHYRRVALEPVYTSTLRVDENDMLEAQAAYAAAHQRTLQERLADDHVADINQKKAPKAGHPTGLIAMEFANGQLKIKE